MLSEELFSEDYDVSRSVDTTTPFPVLPNSPAHSTVAVTVLASVLAVLIAGLWCFRVAANENHHEDLWIYSAGAKLGWQGISPYQTNLMHDQVAQQYPDDQNLIENNGFFLSPIAIFVFAPWQLLSWQFAKLAWCATMLSLGVLTAWKLSTFAPRNAPAWFPAVCVFALLMNPLTMFILIVGQTGLLILACVVVGYDLQRRGWISAGLCLWSLAFIKPHIALPLMLFAGWLGGWQRMMILSVWILGWNVAASLVVHGSLQLLWEYLDFLQAGHQSVHFNKVANNMQITSWNRQIVAWGGPVWEMNATRTILGYFVWLSLVTWRYHQQEVKPNLRWILAVGICGVPLCCQLLAYELPLLILTLPYLLDLLQSPLGKDRWFFIGLLAALSFAFLPGGDGGLAEQIAFAVGNPIERLVQILGGTIHVVDVLKSHRSVGVLLAALFVLSRGSVYRVSPTIEPEKVTTTHTELVVV